MEIRDHKRWINTWNTQSTGHEVFLRGKCTWETKADRARGYVRYATHEACETRKEVRNKVWEYVGIKAREARDQIEHQASGVQKNKGCEARKTQKHLDRVI